MAWTVLKHPGPYLAGGYPSHKNPTLSSYREELLAQIQD